MLTKWFGTRSPAHPARANFIRPELESLEDRLPPSSMHGHGGDNGNGDSSPVQANVQIHDNVHNNVHITNSFDGSTIMNAFNGQNLGLFALPRSSMQGLFTTLYTQAAMINAPAANALVGDEAQLAIDAFLTFEGIPGLSSMISSLQTAIASNTLESSAVGVLLGQVTFDVVLEGMVSSSQSSGF